jgi:hypothetical protein
MSIPKQPKSNKSGITKAANGQACTLLLPGIGHHDPQTVVWAHSPFIGDGKSMGGKSRDWIGCMACSKCHDILDGRTPTNHDREFLRAQFYHAMKVSLMRLQDMGVKLWD